MEKAERKKSKEFVIRSSVLDRQRVLVVDPEYLEFDDSLMASDEPTRFLKAEIDGVRYGVKAIRGYRFRIGRIYCIDIRDGGGRIMKIRLKSVYRVRRKLLGEKWTILVSALFEYYFSEMSSRYLQQFVKGETVELLEVIQIEPNQYRAFVYLNDWNAGVLQAVVDGILKWKFPNGK